VHPAARLYPAAVVEVFALSAAEHQGGHQ